MSLFQKILGIETKQTQYLNDSRQFVQSCNIEQEKQNGVAILTRLEKDITEFDGRVNRFFRHVATSRVAPIMTTEQITQMTEVNLSLEDSNNRKDNEIGNKDANAFLPLELDEHFTNFEIKLSWKLRFSVKKR